MTPTVEQILTGNAIILSGLAAEQGGAEFVGASLGVVAMLSLLAAQEAERGAAARIAENRAILAMLREAEEDYPETAGAKADATEESISALDAVNADLRRRLIALHQAVEQAGDARRDRAILTLYAEMAALRRLLLPAM